jgi:hypothetical protein
MENNFRYNGQLYNRYYAWFPTQVSSGAWTWLTTYYAREVRGQGWITMTLFEFMLDTLQDTNNE